MTTIPMNSKGAVDHGSLSTINNLKVQGIFSVQNIQTLNRPSSSSTKIPAQSQSCTQAASRMPAQSRPQTPSRPQIPSQPQASSGLQSQPRVTVPPGSHAPFTSPAQSGSHTPSRSPAQSGSHAPSRSPAQSNSPHVQMPAAAPAQKRLPAFLKPVQKGQKLPLSSSSPLSRLTACFGWNTTNAQCDVDVSAFLLGAGGRVLGDSWFVFYGQTESPDKSCAIQTAGGQDREIISIDFNRLHPDVKKIVFVLTINEAFEKHLHFGMMKDAYIRILGPDSKEIVSFQMTDYYSNVISMMIGEIYDYNGTWKFHAVGNGVAKDLAGLCGLYGVQVSD